MHQIREDGPRTKLTKQSADLAPVVGAVSGEVLHGLPERILVHAEIERLVFEDAIEIRLRNTVGEGKEFFRVWSPEFAQRRDRLQACSIREGGWRASLKAL